MPDVRRVEFNVELIVLRDNAKGRVWVFPTDEDLVEQESVRIDNLEPSFYNLLALGQVQADGKEQFISASTEGIKADIAKVREIRDGVIGQAQTESYTLQRPTHGEKRAARDKANPINPATRERNWNGDVYVNELLPIALKKTQAEIDAMEPEIVQALAGKLLSAIDPDMRLAPFTVRSPQAS